MDLNTTESYFKKRVNELRRACKDTTPWVFLSAATFLEYLTKLVYGKDRKGKKYKRFIKDYLGKIQPLYKDFIYKDGNRDLPLQIYHVLRCGIVHSFSLIPDDRARTAGGRGRSIALCHKKEAKKKKLAHLGSYQSQKKTGVKDAALFVAEDFVDDLGKVTDLIFKRAKENKTLRNNMRRWINAHPPVTGGF